MIALKQNQYLMHSSLHLIMCFLCLAINWISIFMKPTCRINRETWLIFQSIDCCTVFFQ